MVGLLCCKNFFHSGRSVKIYWRKSLCWRVYASWTRCKNQSKNNFNHWTLNICADKGFKQCTRAVAKIKKFVWWFRLQSKNFTFTLFDFNAFGELWFLEYMCNADCWNSSTVNWYWFWNRRRMNRFVEASRFARQIPANNYDDWTFWHHYNGRRY